MALITVSPAQGALGELHVCGTMTHARHSSSIANRRPETDARRQAILDRLRRQHPDWPEQQILFAALCEMNHGGDAEFMRRAAVHIAEWSKVQSTVRSVRILPRSRKMSA